MPTDDQYDEMYHDDLHKQCNDLALQIDTIIAKFEVKYPGYTLGYDVQDGMSTYYPVEI